MMVPMLRTLWVFKFFFPFFFLEAVCLEFFGVARAAGDRASTAPVSAMHGRRATGM